MRQSTHPAVLVLLGALFLLIPPLLNGFPFIFPDSTDYLTITPHLHRLPFYGLFILFFHWNHFIWAPIVMQCLVVSHLLWLLVKLTSGAARPGAFLFFMAVMTFFTSLPFFTGFIMADIFTPIMFLTYYILAFYHRQLSSFLLYYIFLLACIATVTHISNLSLGLGLLGVLAALMWLTRTPWRERKTALMLVATPILLTFIAVLLFNGVILKIWTVAPAGKSFFMANLIQYGPARNYLDDACPDAGYKICKIERHLPKTADEFLWMSGQFFNLGGFGGMREESATIVRETIRTRPGEVAQMVLDNFLKGLTTHEPAAEFVAASQIREFSELVGKKFGEADVEDFAKSAEMRDTIPHQAIATIDAIVTPTCFLLVLLIALFTLKSRNAVFALAVSTLCFILGNTLLCTTLSGVHDRYQSRVTWLLPMVIGLVLIGHFRKKSA